MEDESPAQEESNVLKFGKGSRVVIGVFSLLFAIIMWLWASNPGNPELGFLNYLPAIFCFFIAGACFLPRKIRGYCGDFIALSVIGMAIWYLIIALPNPEPGQNPPKFAVIFGGLSVLHLVRRYKHYFATKNS